MKARREYALGLAENVTREPKYCLNYKSGLRILIMLPEVPFFWSQKWALLAKVTVFGPQKMALLVAKSKF